MKKSSGIGLSLLILGSIIGASASETGEPQTGLLPAADRLALRLAQLEAKTAALEAENERLRNELRALRGRGTAVEETMQSRLELGILVNDLQRCTGEPGLLIMETKAGLAGAVAGVCAGDVLTAFNGQPLVALADLANGLARVTPGDSFCVVFRKATGAVVEATLKGSGDPFRTALIGLRETRLNGYAAVSELGIECLDGGAQRVTVAAVVKDSPADAAGVVPGDVVVALGGKRVQSPADIIRYAQDLSGPSSLEIALDRSNGTTERLHLDHGGGDHAAAAASEPARPTLGIEVEDDGSAIRVSRVLPGGPSHAALRAGDIIWDVAGKVVHSLDALLALAGDLTPGTHVLMHVLRAGEFVEVDIRP